MQNKYSDLCRAGEAYFKQKSRVRWLKKVDRNTTYFLKKVNGHKARNKIMSITDLEGNRVVEKERVHKEAIDFFSQLLGVSGNTVRNQARCKR